MSRFSQLCQCGMGKYSLECIDKLCKYCCHKPICQRHHTHYSHYLIGLLQEVIPTLTLDVIKKIVYEYLKPIPKCSECRVVKYNLEPLWTCMSCDNLICKKCFKSSICFSCNIQKQVKYDQLLARAFRTLNNSET